MDEDGMLDNGIIPIRNGRLPGQIKLPKRYESACQPNPAMKVPRYRKVSIAQMNGNTMNDRIEDLTQAMLWIKQELIMLRQHDILLKRQFFNIQDTIKSLHKHSDSNMNGSLETDCKGDHSEPIVHVFLRSSSSITAINESDDDESGSDDSDFRPRTASMTTSRDLAALARRRGSKELI
ncbi:hypothetical protein LOTGIDRAFT_152116 [Lottia gigantea]|uniref:Uncharacterized protein n=1 Tax=Lottia gigantea TaxID=225164 RepID=V4BC90_LOTGI|nr:hypothetical protein LOTGIDRAFT_152116 [Lottia gigantea]ESP05286.1 hypothetical protein LOTGIDRAFT_152116 [Lottia gigantea]